MDTIVYEFSEHISCLLSHLFSLQSSKNPLANIFLESDAYLESDCDEQLLITVGFNQSVKLSALSIVAKIAANAPKTVKIFVNSTALDFDRADSSIDTQTITLTPADLTGNLVPLRFVKFQDVSSICLFVKNNQGGEDSTIINSLRFIGQLKGGTNMSDFKRVAGKKGE